MFPDREHIVSVTPQGLRALRAWLRDPNGGLNLGRVTFEAVENGGIWVRTQPYRYKEGNDAQG